MTSDRGPEGEHLQDHFLTAARLAKVEALRAEGVDPYPVLFTPTATAAALHEAHAGLAAGEGSGVRVTAAGRPETGFIRECPDRAPVFVWVDTGPTAEELLADAVAEAWTGTSSE